METFLKYVNLDTWQQFFNGIVTSKNILQQALEAPFF